MRPAACSASTASFQHSGQAARRSGSSPSSSTAAAVLCSVLASVEQLRRRRGRRRAGGRSRNAASEGVAASSVRIGSSAKMSAARSIARSSRSGRHSIKIESRSPPWRRSTTVSRFRPRSSSASSNASGHGSDAGSTSSPSTSTAKLSSKIRSIAESRSLAHAIESARAALARLGVASSAGGSGRTSCTRWSPPSRTSAARSERQLGARGAARVDRSVLKQPLELLARGGLEHAAVFGVVEADELSCRASAIVGTPESVCLVFVELPWDVDCLGVGVAPSALVVIELLTDER